MKTPIENIFQAYKTTAEALDLDGHLSMYAEDILLFDLWDQWSLQGKQALRKMVSEWFGSIGNEHLRIEFDQVATRINGDAGFGTAIVKYAGVSASGEVVRWLENRMTMICEKRGGAWVVVHQHTSAPVGDDMKVKLQR